MINPASTLICFAVREEAGKTVLNAGAEVLITGMGRRNAEESIQRRLAANLPALVLTCGFAGGLNPNLPGRTVVFCADEQTGLTTALSALGAVPVRFHCAGRVAITAVEKQQLWQTTGADAVELFELIQSVDSLTLVRKLAAKGANLNARMRVQSNAGLSALNTLGATPFLMAARCADAEYMRLLARLGADPLLPNDDNTTPLIVAAGVGTRSPEEDAGTESEVVEAVKAALELGNDINAVDAKGETAMHGPAYKHLPAVVLLLAEKGARIDVWNRKNRLGWTPLRIAEGVHRTGNFRLSPPTAAALRKVMSAAGVSTELDTRDIGTGTVR